MLTEFVAWLLSGWFTYVGDMQTDREMYDAVFGSVTMMLSILLPCLCFIAFLWLVNSIFRGKK